MSVKQFSVIKYITLCVIGVLLFGQIIFNVSNYLEANKFSSFSIDDGWTVIINSDVYENVNLPEFKVPRLSKGDSIVLIHEIPHFSCSEPVIRFYSSYCTVDASVHSFRDDSINGQSIYSYGKERAEKNKNVGCGYHLMQIDKSQIGSIIKIELSATENNAFSYFNRVFIESASETFSALFTQRAFTVAVSEFFLLLGILGTIGSVFLFVVHIPARNFLIFMHTSIWLGLCLLHNNGCYLIFYGNFPFNSWMETVTIYGTNITLMGVVYQIILTDRKYKRIAKYLIIVTLIYVLITLLLDSQNIVHLCKSRIIFICFTCIEAVFMFIIVLQDSKEKTLSKSMPTIGIVIFLLFVVLEMIRVLISLGHSNVEAFPRGTFVALGSLIFMTTILQNFLVRVETEAERRFDREQRKKEKNVDYLTGLSNAETCRKTIARYCEEKKENVSVSVIRLMPVSDDTPVFGTLEGDDFLCRFAGYLQGMFANYGIICRIQQGYFCAVSTSLSTDKLSRLERTLKDLLFAEMQRAPKMQYALHMGYAFNYEEESPQSLFILAEERMKEKAYVRR